MSVSSLRPTGDLVLASFKATAGRQDPFKDLAKLAAHLDSIRNYAMVAPKHIRQAFMRDALVMAFCPDTVRYLPSLFSHGQPDVDKTDLRTSLFKTLLFELSH